MRIGAMIGGETAGEIVGKARDLEERGFDSVWIGDFLGYGMEALTAMTLIARETKRIELGTAVVPIYFHHPLALADQAVSIQQVAKGQFTLGIGLSHPFIVEDWLGMPYAGGAAKMSDYHSIIRPLLNSATAEFPGEHYSAHAGIHLGPPRSFRRTDGRPAVGSPDSGVALQRIEDEPCRRGVALLVARAISAIRSSHCDRMRHS